MTEMQLVLLEPAKVVLSQIGKFLVYVLVVLLILLIGWLVARVIRTVVTRGLRMVKLDDLSDRIELDSLLEKGGIKYSLSELIGIICYWLAMLISFVVAVNAIGLTVAADLLNRIVLYIPHVIAAIFIIILGMFASTALRNFVQTAATNAGLSQVNFLSKTVETLVLIFAIIMALQQLRIDTRLVELIVTVALASIGLGVALAFGLGCKELAGKMAAEFLEKFKTKK